MNGAPVGDLPHLYATVKLWENSHSFSHEWESVGNLKKDDFEFASYTNHRNTCVFCLSSSLGKKSDATVGFTKKKDTIGILIPT